MENIEVKVAGKMYEFQYASEVLEIPETVYLFYIKPKKKSKIAHLYPGFFMTGREMQDGSIKIYFNEYNTVPTHFTEEISRLFEKILLKKIQAGKINIPVS